MEPLGTEGGGQGAGHAQAAGAGGAAAQAGAAAAPESPPRRLGLLDLPDHLLERCMALEFVWGVYFLEERPVGWLPNAQPDSWGAAHQRALVARAAHALCVLPCRQELKLVGRRLRDVYLRSTLFTEKVYIRHAKLEAMSAAEHAQLRDWLVARSGVVQHLHVG